MNSLESLLSLRACPDGLKWARSVNDPATQDGWLACPRGDWMAWYAGKKSDTPEAVALLNATLSECAGYPVDVSGEKDRALAAAKVIAAMPGNHTENMKRCADIFRAHYPTVP